MKRKRDENTICTSINNNNITTVTVTTKKKNDDVYSRASTTNQKGRGSLSGWTTCPLCNISSSTKSQKIFSLGRGISMHLQQGTSCVGYLFE